MRSRRMPALLTRMSSRPKASTAERDEVAGAVPVGDVVVRRQRLAAAGPDLLHDRIRGVAQVVDDDLGALGGEEQGVLAPESAAGPRDDRDPAVQ